VVLQSELSESQGRLPKRSSCYFEAEGENRRLIFGKALAFYEVVEYDQWLVIYQPLDIVQKPLTTLKARWSKHTQIIPVKSLCNLIGILTFGEKVYVLRKHPGLTWLSDTERGIEKNTEKGVDSDEESENEDELMM